MAQTVTTAFWPIFPRKSDGHEVVTQKGIQIKNGPNAQQLDRTPNAQGQCDYYRLIDREEPKHIDWRKKLGGMLLRELGGKEHEDKWAQTLLYDLPEGYRLYEHIKSKADGQAKAVKNHSGGGHDRQDAYLYGYPKGPKKRFRSPIEFFPHLLWLCTDETNDFENCTCKLCSPVQVEQEKPTVKAEPPQVIKKEESVPAIVQQNTTAAVRHPVVQVPIRRPSTGPAQSPAPNPATPNTTVTRPLPPPQAAALPQPRSIDQQVDGQYHKFLARTGEIVWFHREKARAWGLGLVVRRWRTKDGSNAERPAYMVQPLSHPFSSPPPEIIQADDRLKPWLAWSAPSCTYPFLQQHPHLQYDQVDWRALISGQYGDGNPEVDASILAAKAIDVTYTLCEPLKTLTNGGYEERHWNGFYFGAERVWNGEPVRLRIGSGTDIMVISSIIERVVPNPPAPQNGAPPQPPTSHVHVIGDVYTYATIQVPVGQSIPQIQQSSNIPIRMREDMIWRNKILLEETRSIAYWKLIATQQRLDISEIKGRWYEASIVFVEPFKTAVQKKEGGNGIWMNSRGDATGMGKGAGIKKEDRVQAFGHAVPANSFLMEGLDIPRHEELGKPPTNDVQGLEMAGNGGADAPFILDEFMNLEGIEGDSMGFDNHFTF